MKARLLVSLALLAAAAHASSVTDELGVNSSQVTGNNPRTGYLSDSLNASFDLSDQWALNAGILLTLESRTPAAARGAFGTSASTVASLNAGVDWSANDNWTLGTIFDVSPQSTMYAGTQVQVTAAGDDANALLRSTTSSWDGSFDLSYDTAGESNLEWSFSADYTRAHLGTDQAITRVRTAKGVDSTTQSIRDYCATHKCPRELLLALRPQTGVSLDSNKISLGATATVFRNTDLTLVGDYYGYDQDPAAVGYFSVASVGRVGQGVPIAPLQYLIRAEMVQRIGGFSARLWLQGGKYEEGTGENTKGLGLKLQYKFNKAWRAWATLSGQSDVGVQCAPLTAGGSASAQCMVAAGQQGYYAAGETTNSGGFALGAGYRF
jgi:hypothetical protein